MSECEYWTENEQLLNRYDQLEPGCVINIPLATQTKSSPYKLLPLTKGIAWTESVARPAMNSDGMNVT